MRAAPRLFGYMGTVLAIAASSVVPVGDETPLSLVVRAPWLLPLTMPWWVALLLLALSIPALRRAPAPPGGLRALTWLLGVLIAAGVVFVSIGAFVANRPLVAMLVTFAFAAPAVVSFLWATQEDGLERFERLADPVVDPLEPRGLVELELVLEILAHPRHQEGMGIAGDDLGKRAHPRPRPRILRQQRRLRMRLVEVFHDRQRLEQHRAVAVDQRGDQHLRVHLAERLLALPALDQVDIDDLVGHDALEVERDAHPESGERAPERKQLHGEPPAQL